jgi:hypothetical protein
VLEFSIKMYEIAVIVSSTKLVYLGFCKAKYSSFVILVKVVVLSPVCQKRRREGKWWTSRASKFIIHMY